MGCPQKDNLAASDCKMMFASLTFALTVFLSLSTTFGQDTSLAAVKAAFQAADIPKDATIAFNPVSLLEVQFPQDSGPSVHVKAGVQLPRNKTAIPPVFGVQHSALARTPKGTFVVAMVDLDAPTPQNPNVSQIRHFLGDNFTLQPPNRNGLSLLSNTTPALSDFLQPTPPAGSDPHRYVFLLFEQPKAFNKQQFVNASTPVTNFNISQFADETGLGRPLGGSFIRVGPDPTD